mgnify:CR=1 FL=1
MIAKADVFIQNLKPGAVAKLGFPIAELRRKYPKLIVCSDVNEAGTQQTAKSVGGVAITANVSKEADIQNLIETVEGKHGPIDLFCSNAGILGGFGGLELNDDEWQQVIDVNLNGYFLTAREAARIMLANGGGSIVEWTNTLDGALKLDFETAIPGHGPIMKKADVVKFRNDIVAMRTRVSSAIKGGASQDQVTKLLTSEFGWQEGGMQLRMGGPGMYNELKAAN